MEPTVGGRWVLLTSSIPQKRAAFPLETLAIPKIVLFESEELVKLLDTLAPCAALRSLTFTECSSDKMGDTAPYRGEPYKCPTPPA